MSGGYFDYEQFRIGHCEDQLEQYLLDNKYGYSQETIAKFKEGLSYLKLARIYLHRIDYLLEFDDGEDSFHKRLVEDLTTEFN